MRPAGLPQPGLVHVRVKVSGVISAPLAPVWGIVRSFANLGSWLEPVNGASMRTELLVCSAAAAKSCSLIGVFVDYRYHHRQCVIDSA